MTERPLSPAGCTEFRSRARGTFRSGARQRDRLLCWVDFGRGRCITVPIYERAATLSPGRMRLLILLHACAGAESTRYSRLAVVVP